MENHSYFSPEEVKKIFGDLTAKEQAARTPEQVKADLDIQVWAAKAKKEKEILQKNQNFFNGKK